MLSFIQGKSSERKLRLFVCGYFRITSVPADVDEQSRLALETSERFADGLATAEELEASRQRANEAWRTGNAAGIHAANAAASDASWAAGRLFGHLKIIAVERNKVQLLHDLWGPLSFRPMSIDSAWLTPKVVQLTQSIYDNRAFDRLPALADALEQAGCHDADILGHCRRPGVHVRGCWVLDLLLGKA
jgi:hypothetical protein